MTIFDTDFVADDKIIINIDGFEVYVGEVGNMTENQKREYAGFTWYLLDSVEEAKAVFVG